MDWAGYSNERHRAAQAHASFTERIEKTLLRMHQSAAIDPRLIRCFCLLTDMTPPGSLQIARSTAASPFCPLRDIRCRDRSNSSTADCT